MLWAVAALSCLSAVRAASGLQPWGPWCLPSPSLGPASSQLEKETSSRRGLRRQGSTLAENHTPGQLRPLAGRVSLGTLFKMRYGFCIINGCNNNNTPSFLGLLGGSGQRKCV